MIYTMDELKARVAPVAEKYGLPAVYVFGSYARGEATEESDVDLIVDRTGTGLLGFFALGRLLDDLEAALEKPVDMVQADTLAEDYVIERTPWFVENANKERKNIWITEICT